MTHMGLASNRKDVQQNIHKFTDNAALGTREPALIHFYMEKGKGTLNTSDFKGKKKKVYIHTH